MKVIFEFTKTGNMVYISHLDLSRLFLRVLRMSGLRPAYSHGFNPHPKMSFALPLALGVHSTCELLEFEIDGVLGAPEVGAAVDAVNERLPEGIRVIAWHEKSGALTKSLAACACAAEYEVMIDGLMDAPALLAAFFAKESVIVKKRDKKTGGETEKDIRPEMLSYRIIKDLRGRLLAEVRLGAAPGGTLGPAVFLNAFFESSGVEGENYTTVITRTAILDGTGDSLVELAVF